MRKENVIAVVMITILISTILSSCLIEDEKEQENGREITIDTICNGLIQSVQRALCEAIGSVESMGM